MKGREPAAELSVERGADLASGARRGRDPSVVFPLSRSAVSVRAEGLEARLDRSSFALLPAEASYRLTPETIAPEVVTLVLLRGAWAAAEREYRPHFDEVTWREVVARPRLFVRTRWVDEIVHRFVFEVLVCKKPASSAARFLETELAKEVYFLGKEQLEGQNRAALQRDEDGVARRALEWMDQHLFEPFSLEDLARYCRASESTLLRSFRRETGGTPVAYLREKRLSEARLLLENNRCTVGEVAQRVGYTNLPAFTAAFGRRFGVPPSEVRPREDASALLPPHGQPPLRPGRGQRGRKRPRA